ncbi:hypothetical protein Q31a_35510 [Aureliella helgolandensis]|uniref:Uncharacterized protein n=1 Tax=Aureliella helgolandensis TaxID=2527968 RepID=A0A518G9F2_9BACT|nr:hypothetical protein Q31a_35510 [Aureliella helgolandensis]
MVVSLELRCFVLLDRDFWQWVGWHRKITLRIPDYRSGLVLAAIATIVHFKDIVGFQTINEVNDHQFV